jgi:hypothetical protein
MPTNKEKRTGSFMQLSIAKEQNNAKILNILKVTMVLHKYM